MVPAPIERSEVRGHDNRSENLQHLQRNSSAFDTFAAVSRAREARAGSSELRGRATCSSRLVGAAAAGDVVIFVLAKLLVGRFRFGADDGAQAVAADVGFAGSGRWRWCRRRSSAARYGVMTTDRKICSTYRGTAQRSTLSLPSRARARRAPVRASSEAERPARAAWSALRL